MERSENRRRPRQIALSFGDTRLIREGIDAVRYDIEHLIKLSQRFWETTKDLIQKRVLGEQSNIARIEPLGFVEVGLALVPLASPACDIGQGFGNLTAIGQKRSRLLEVTDRGVVIL